MTNEQSNVRHHHRHLRFFFFVATMQRASLHHDYLHLDLVHKTRERVDH
jgi:hypothetical protein